MWFDDAFYDQLYKLRLMTQKLPSNFTAKARIYSPCSCPPGAPLYFSLLGGAGGGRVGGRGGCRGVNKDRGNEGGDEVTSSGMHVKISVTFGGCLRQLAQAARGKNNNPISGGTRPSPEQEVDQEVASTTACLLSATQKPVFCCYGSSSAIKKHFNQKLLRNDSP